MSIESYRDVRDPEDVWEDIGYSHPYDVATMTIDQALALAGQEAGGPDALRVAHRVEDKAAADASIGQPEGTADRSPEQELVAAQRWEKRVSAEISALEGELSEVSSPKKQADLERRKKVREGILERIERLELPMQLEQLNADIAAAAQERVDAARFGLDGREANGRDLLMEKRTRVLTRLAELGIVAAQ